MILKLLLVIHFCVAFVMQFQDPNTGKKELPVRDYRSLINSMASKNARPRFSSNGAIRGTHFDWEEQKRVSQVLSELSPLTLDEWTILIEFLEDDRYSITGYEKSPNAPTNFSVAQLCKDVARAQVTMPVVSVLRANKIATPTTIRFPSCKKDLLESQIEVISKVREWLKNQQIKEGQRKAILNSLDELMAELKRNGPKFYTFSWDNFTWLREPKVPSGQSVPSK